MTSSDSPPFWVAHGGPMLWSQVAEHYLGWASQAQAWLDSNHVQDQAAGAGISDTCSNSVAMIRYSANIKQYPTLFA